MRQTIILIGVSIIFAGMVACSSTQKTADVSDSESSTEPVSLNEVRDAFTQYWSKKAKKVKVLEVVEMNDGWFRGNGVLDQRPVEEFYDSVKKTFTRNRPMDSAKSEAAEELSYKKFVTDMTVELAKKLPEGSRVAVIDFPSTKGRLTELSQDLATKVEVALVGLDQHVVDRMTLTKVLNEQQLQQKEGALFDAAALTRIGKLVGATVVVHGSYSLLEKKQLTVTLKAISTETAKVISIAQEEYPLTGAGAGSRESVMKMAETSLSATE